jgi:hypothetical protein
MFGKSVFCQFLSPTPVVNHFANNLANWASDDPEPTVPIEFLKEASMNQGEYCFRITHTNVSDSNPNAHYDIGKDETDRTKMS